MKTETIRARMEPDTKRDAEAILNELGISVSQVINALYKQIILRNGIPFEIRIPNKETAKTIEDTNRGVGLNKCKDAQDMFDQLGI